MKILRKIRDAVKGLKEIPSDIKEFGFYIASIRYRRKISLISAENYINIISKKMEKEISSITKKYENGKIKVFKKKVSFEGKIPIFVCWFQGEKNMPEWCKSCYNNLKKITPLNAVLVLITIDNYLSYIDLPEYIIEKFNKGNISPANYSDIVRYTLLATYGGCWIDAAIYLTGDIFQTAFQYELFTPKFMTENSKIQDASRGLWVGGVWFSKKENILFKYVAESLIYFWTKHNKALDYLGFDYIIWVGYSNIEEITNLINSIPNNNTNIRLMNSLFEEKYSSTLLEKIISTQDIHLINRHKEYNKIKNCEQTLYGFLVESNENN